MLSSLEFKIFNFPVPNGLEKALAACEQNYYSPIFMPELVDYRSQAKPCSYLLGNLITTSIIVSGKTKQSNSVVIYIHRTHYFSYSDAVKSARERGLLDGAGIMPLRSFQSFLDLEDNQTVFVRDYNLLAQAKYGLLNVDTVLEHPQTIPFLGGEEIAERYLNKHKQVYGKTIGMCFSSKLSDQPLARFLSLNSVYNGDNHLNSKGFNSSSMVLGIRQKSN